MKPHIIFAFVLSAIVLGLFVFNEKKPRVTTLHVYRVADRDDEFDDFDEMDDEPGEFGYDLTREN